MSDELRAKYFTQVGDCYEVNDELRNMVRAQRINLANSSLLLPKFDLIMVRNVLIYFDVVHKRKLLHQIQACMQPWTPLILGAGETTVNVDDHFHPVDHDSFRCFQLCEETI